MAPKKVKIFTLKEAIDYLETLKNAKNSILNWVSSLTTLVHYDVEGDQAFASTLTKKEQAIKHADVNIVPLLHDFDKVVEIIETKILSSRSRTNIAIDTQKQVYLAIVRLTQKGSMLQLSKELKGRYNDKLQDVEQASNEIRNQNAPKRGNKENPDFLWTTAIKEYEDFFTTHSFTNTTKGRKDLRNAAITGMYVCQRPRRIQDYSMLQYYSKKPTDKENEGRNILYADGDKLFLSLDVFKTRWRVSGASKVKKELLPRYVKEVNSILTSILKDYIKKWGVKDMSKVTPAEKRANTNYYVFFKETGTSKDVYDEGSFSKVVSNCFKQVFNKRKGLSVNTLRHAFNTWIAMNINQFTDAQLQEISVDVGDTKKQLPTHLRYRIAYQMNAGIEKTEIEGLILDYDFAREEIIANMQQEGSTGQPVNPDEDEINSPAPKPQEPLQGITNDTGLNELYQRLGKAYIEMKQLELLIMLKTQ